MTQQDDHIKGLIITVIGVLIITPDALLIRLVSTDHWTTLFWRGLLSAIAIAIVIWPMYRRNPLRQITDLGWPGFFFALLFTVSSFFFVYSINHTKVANALFIASAAPLFAALYARLFLKERVPLRTWLAITAAIAGIAVIAGGSLEGGSASLAGDLAALAAAAGIAGSLTIARRYRTRNMVPAASLSGLLLALTALPLAEPLSVPSADFIYLALMGFLVVPLPFSLLAIGPRYLPAPEVGLLLLLEAVIGPFWVWLVLDEFPGLPGIAGGAIIIGTIVALNAAALYRLKRAP